MINKVAGTNFENYLCNELRNYDFWCRPMYPAPNGSQPFDVMLINTKGNLFCIECKDCRNDRFDLNRIEDNQRLVLNLLMYHCNLINNCYFAFRTSKGIYFIDALKISDEYMKRVFENKGNKFLDLNYISNTGNTIDEFARKNI